MPDQPLSVDGVGPVPEVPAAPTAAPQAQNPSVAVRRWERLLIILGSIFYVIFGFWCFALMAILPSTDASMAPLVSVGLLTALGGAVVFVGGGFIGLMRIGQAKTQPRVRTIALIKLVIVTVPGLLLCAILPLWIMRQPELPIAIVSPTESKDMVAPVSVTFSVEQAVALLANRGVTPISFKWDLNGDDKADQETVVPKLSALFDHEGVYGVTVLIVGSDGSTRRATRSFVIQQSVFSVLPTIPLVNTPVILNVENLIKKGLAIDHVEWDYNGDGKADDTTKVAQVTHTFYQLGDVTVSALIQFTNKTQASYQRTITIQNPPPLPFPVTLTSEPRYLIGPAPFSALFTIDTKEPLADVNWTFGDGENAVGQRIAHTYKQKGTYSVTANVRSSTGTLAQLSTVVQVVDTLQLPDLTFEGTPAVTGNRISGEVPLTLNLQPHTNTPFVQFHWEVPDATEVGSTDGALQAIYRREGTYTVTLIAQDPENKVLRQPFTVEVKPPSSSLSIVMDPETGIAPLTVNFDASETFIPGESITGFIWDYGDQTGQDVGGARAQHIFTKSGTYTVKLVVKTTSGKQLSTTKTISVRQPDITSCILASRVRGAHPLGVEFDSSCSSGTIQSYLWDFGDGAQSDQPSPVHVFLDAGTYTVTLTIHDITGATAVQSVIITVE